jgi:phospholipid/cholesterol/gamma-HCH transport system substrate-binding protein
MSRNIVETVLGAVVLLAAVAFLAFAYARGNVGGTDGYELIARFDRVDGLSTGADVRISGIRVGTVQAQWLDPETYRATVRFTVAPNVELPADTSAAIVSEGLLGGKYVALNPGGDDRLLGPGDEIRLTQSSVVLEDLIGQMIFGAAQGGQP